MTVTDLVERCKRQMEAITGLHPDAVSRLDRSADGWTLGIDMLEHRSVPRTQDLLAAYEVAIDPDGEVLTWKRVSRFTRAQGTETT
jgi:hypothetical protein